jgi:hypothetical protein
MNHKQVLQSVIVVILGILFLVGCGGTAPTPAAEAPTATSAPEQAVATPTAPLQPPDGTYTTTITEAELSPSVPEQFVCENAGTFTLTVSGDQWSLSQVAAPGCTVADPENSGSWEFSSNQVTFHDNQSFGCSLAYTYQWSFEGTELRFTTVEDNCAPRVVLFSTHPWVRQE